ncbi:MAG TPA: glutamyl-tRNA amidotransferase [Opitutae bacterium]|nr:glutamyl-tRNA amidotransferase [Opitutaceae bacterium]HCR30011.1 glutamyl-tRNA amidotransferase [Opitutae bacterium]|tara:strand:+ start:68 stop:505 length:438 start_codon:yes stop_codon:yes gene_type:complete
MKEELKKLHQKARIDRDASGTQAYGAALAAIQEGEVRANEDFDEAKSIAVVEKEAGKFKESAEAFTKAGRSEKAAELQACADLLIALLPAKLEEGAYPKIVSEAIAAVGATSMKEMGAVMAALKKDHGTALDMKIASAAVKDALA